MADDIFEDLVILLGEAAQNVLHRLEPLLPIVDLWVVAERERDHRLEEGRKEADRKRFGESEEKVWREWERGIKKEKGLGGQWGRVCRAQWKQLDSAFKRKYLCRTQWFHYNNSIHTCQWRKHTHTNTQEIEKDSIWQLSEKNNIRKRPHTFQRNIPSIHPSERPTNCSKSHTNTHTHALGVLSLMAARGESEELTSPTNTVHPVCMWARRRAAVRAADVLLHITNVIYNQGIWVCIPTMRSVWNKNTFGGGMTSHSPSCSCCTSIIGNQNLTNFLQLI